MGARSTKTSIKSALSPDGQWIISGSEDGSAKIFDSVLCDKLDVAELGISFNGPVTDVAWNPNYHMIAVCGFGAEFPILVFVNKEREEQNMQKMLDKI